MFSIVCSDRLVKIYSVAWSPDASRLVSTTRHGFVIQVTNNDLHSSVYKDKIHV